MAQTKDANVESRNLSSFHQIEVSSAVVLYLTQGTETSVAVSTKDKTYNELIVTEVSNGKLKIYEKSKSKQHHSIQAKVYVTFTNLQALTVSGASKAVFVKPAALNNFDINISGASSLEVPSLKTNECYIDCSGASQLTINIAANKIKMELKGASGCNGTMNGKEIECKISGASSANLKGQAETLTVKASGASSFKGSDLQSDTCAVAASGASSVLVHANKQLSVQSHGGSTVQYEGNAQLSQIDISGGSSFKKHS
jgi:hypothetical protein